jgi:hypothetical protein
MNAKVVFIERVGDVGLRAVALLDRPAGRIVPAEQPAGRARFEAREVLRPKRGEKRCPLIEQLRLDPRQREAGHLDAQYWHRDGGEPQQRPPEAAAPSSRGD